MSNSYHEYVKYSIAKIDFFFKYTTLVCKTIINNQSTEGGFRHKTLVTDVSPGRGLIEFQVPDRL